MDERDRHAAFADGGGDSLDEARAHVAAREDPGHARLEQVRIAVARPVGGGDVVAGEDEPALVERDLRREPAGLGVRADEDVDAARRPALDRPAEWSAISISSIAPSPWAPTISLRNRAVTFDRVASWRIR